MSELYHENEREGKKYKTESFVSYDEAFLEKT